MRERQEHWRGEFWNIPSGEVTAHETPAVGAVRELAEETGLVVSPDDLRLVGTSSTTSAAGRYRAWNFATVVDSPDIAIDDPEGLILEARWFDRVEAIRLLGLLPYRPIAEPLVAYLDETVEPGSHWHYDAAESDPVVTSPRSAPPP